MASRDRSTSAEIVHTDGSPRWLRWALPAALLVLACLPFLPVLGFGFVELDDHLNFFPKYNPAFNTESHALSGPTLEWMLTTSHGGHYQPLTWLSLALDAALTGRFDPRDLHRTNLLLHGLNAVLLYWLALLLLRSAFAGRARDLDLRLGAAATSLLYAVHPLRVESVAWITERRDVLSGALILVAVIAYVRFATAGSKRALWMGLSLVFFTLSLLAKAWGITLPALLLLLDVYPLRRRAGERAVPWSRLIGEKLLYLPVALVFAWLAMNAQVSSRAAMSLEHHDAVQRLAQACFGLWFYVSRTVWPAGLSPLYQLELDLDPTRLKYVASMVGVGAFAAAVFALRRKLPGLAAAALAFAIVVSPVLGFLQSGPQEVADRYTYLAAMPLMLLVGAGGVLWLQRSGAAVARRRAVLAAAVLVVAGLLGWLTREQTRFWSDSETVFRRIVEVEPENYFGQHNLSVLLQRPRETPRQESLEEALLHARASVDANPGPGNAEARSNLVNVLRALGRHDEADKELAEAFEVAPDWPPILRQTVQRYLDAGNPEAALTAVDYVLGLSPSLLDGYSELARIQRARNRPELVLEAYRRGLAVDPGWPEGNYALGLVALDAGDPAQAEAHFERAMDAGAVDPDLLTDLGRAYQAQGRKTDAADFYRRALELRPDHGRARALLEALR